MILRLFARIHGRLRRRFFRLNHWTRYGLALFLVVLVVSGAELGLAWHYAHVMPWYDKEVIVYAAWQHDDRLFEHNAVVASALAQATGESVESLSIVLDAVKAMQAEEYRFVTKQGMLAFYAVGAQAPAGILPDGWHMQTIDPVSNTVAVSTQTVAAAPSFQWQWFTAMRLRALQVRFPVVLTMHVAPWPLFYGGIDVKDTGWDMLLSPASGPIRHAKLSQQQLTTLATVRTTQAFPPAARSLSFVHSIASPVWTSLFAAPFTLSLTNGTLFDLVDPFAPNVAWQLAISGSSQQASTWLQTVLETLMMRFPLAEQRVLPDKSVVYELKRKPDFFLPQGANVNVDEHATGSLTFPHDQITYTYENGVLVAGKGTVAAAPESFPVCQVPQALSEVFLSSQALGTSLWKTLYFGLDKEKMAVCVRW